MKRTRRKNVWRGIRSSRNRFFSILFIVALGSGFMAGLAAASPDMYEAADRYMDEQVWYDADIKGTQGLSEENLEALRLAFLRDAALSPGAFLCQLRS